MTAAMGAAGVAALTMLVIVVIAADIRIVAEISGQQRMDSRVGITADAAEEPAARLCQRLLCAAAAATARTLGYEPLILTDCLSCEAREAGVFLANMVRYQRTAGRRIALIAGGETVVHLTGHGKGGRNQELALAAAPGIAGLDGCAVFSVGSDGTDGPTDAAGGFVDSTTQAALKAQGCDIFATLADNDAYHALQKCNGLIITGPTGTNVNDVSVALVRA